MNTKASYNIFFVGGIHGVGKSTICKQLALDLNINYLSASEVLKWKEINNDSQNKKVDDIPGTQGRLIRGLKNTVVPQEHYILDGHFCLFDRDGIVTKIPLSTFAGINPKYLIIIVGDVIEILNNLQSRDQKTYSVQTLVDMQELELEYANDLSNKLKIPLYIFNKIDYFTNHKNLLSQLNESLT